jgi:carbon monoxide dehydrogenase subunit G
VQLENSFTVPVPVDEAWRVLLDIERIAPCMPGAALDTVTEDDFTGQIKVKLGPINLTYQGKASIIEKDEAAHRAVIDARGRDQRGNGTATATVTAQLRAEGAATRVDVLTDLNITGRPAQFGRGVMTDVGNKLLGQFADKLAAQLRDADAPPAAGTHAETPAVRVVATVTGAVEEIAGSAEQAAGEGTVTRRAAAATRKAAASATDTVTGAAAKPPAPAEEAPAEKAAATADAAPAPTDTAPAAAATAPAARHTAPAAKAPSMPPKGPTAPPTRPATGAPLRSVPSDGTSAPQVPTTRPAPAEPEAIDLLEVAGGAAVSRYAAPAAGVAAVVLVIALLVRRRRRR